MTSYVKRGVVLALISSLTGCGTVLERNEIRTGVDEGSKTVQDRLGQIHDEDRKRGAVVREIDGVWLGGKTIKVAREAELPAVFSQPIGYAFPDKPSLTVVSDRVSKIVGMPIRVTPDALIPIEVFSAQRMSMLGGANAMQAALGGANGSRLPASVVLPPQTGPIGQFAPNMMTGTQQVTAQPGRSFIIDQTSPFGGTLSEFLDQLSAKFGVGWDYKDGTITISRIVTRSYQLATLNDINDVTSTIAKTASTGDSNGSGSSSSGSSTGVSQAGNVSSSADVSSKNTAKVDVASGMETAIKGTLTPNIGKYSMSSSGIITVTDTREVQEQVRTLIDAENRSIGRQVSVRMQIVDFTTTVANDMAVDWSWVINAATAKWNVNFFAPQGLPGGSTGFGQLGVIRNGGNSTTQTFLQALSSVGKVSVRKDETYTMLNNRPLSIANTDNFIYPARSTSAASTANSSTTTPGIEPGQLTTGTFLNLRASVQPNSSVIMSFSLDSSLRGDVTQLESNGVKLQYPQSSANQYAIYTSIRSGDTRVLVGVDNTQRQAMDKSFDGTLTPLLGGGIATSTTRRVTLVLLTPQIIEGVN